MSSLDLKQHVVKEIVVSVYPKISPEDDMRKVCTILIETPWSGLPIVDNGVIVGFISEKECLDFLLNISNYDIQYAFVKDYMTKSVLTIHSQMSIEKVSKFFKKNPHHVYPVEEAGEVLGLIFRKDLVKYLNQIDSSLWSTK